ncbi:MAG: hypothetical protein A2Y77_04930 [Planctomycetes bacterium RBG_13_62_9]|nr:MAG: hypothetical protein A2Y77_04930 [Planctomycetes bacterium RBG_13_62_9]
MNRKTSFFIVWALLSIMLCDVASAALVGWWKFDETSGTGAKDSSGQGNDGTVVGNAKWATGKVGGAFEFDGSTYINCGRKPSLNVRDQITIAFCFKVQAFTNTWEAFLAKGDGAYRSSRSNGTDNATHMGITGGNYFDAVTIITDNQWHFWTGTYNGAEARIYIDGKLDASRQYSGQIGDSSSYDLYIGENQQATGRLLHGLLDDVRIYDKALNEQQVQDLITGGPAPTWNKAEKPDPADGAIGVGVPLLRWSKGETAMFHSIYLSTSPDLTAADLKTARSPVTLYYHIPGFLPGTTYYWRVDEIEKDGVTTYTGDVWSFVTQALTSYYPFPTDQSNTASPAPTLTWMAGAGAVKHHLYFGSSQDAVSQGTADTDKGTFELGEATFEPGTLDSLATYYWRVDELVADGSAKTGPVWSFTTVQPVDDFEGYTDDEGSRIYETWVDGLTNGLSGSTVGNAQAPFAEQTVVHGGKQAMPLDYNNVAAPFYSEAEQEFAPTQDWTANGVEALVLYVRGRLVNSASPLYVGIEDAATHVGIVYHPDPAAVLATKWLEWKIPFSEFTAAGVNMARVKKLYIGVGDKANPKADGTGRIYIDDIGVAKP